MKEFNKSRMPATNTGFASGGVMCKLEALCFYSSVVLVDSLCSETRPNAKPQNVGSNVKRTSRIESEMKQFLVSLLIFAAFKSFGQEAIFATIAGGDLYSFDVENCTRTFIGSTGHGFGDIAFTPNGELWGIISGDLYQIDTATANATLIGSTGIGAVSLVGLDDTTLLAESGFNLYGINTNTGSSFYIDTIGFQASGDLTWYDENLYLVTSAGQIIKMTLDNSVSSILSIAPIGSNIPTCEGAVTASFTEDFNSIVGFNGPDLIKICQIDGSHQLLCPSLNVGGTPGAASIRLASQTPTPTTCSMTSIDEVSNDTDFLIFPNPANESISVSSYTERQFGYSIYNIVGQQIQSGTTKTSAPIIIDKLCSGLYSIEIITEGIIRTQRFVVRK